MSLLSRVTDRFKFKIKTIDGRAFYGYLLDIPDTSRVSNFLSARRYLRTHATKTPVAPREVIIVAGQKYIVADHGVGFFKVPIYKHFKLFEVDKIMNWKSQQKTINPVTGVHEITRDQDQGDIYLSVQPDSDKEDKLKIPTNYYTAVTNADVQIDDLLDDNYVVTKTDQVLGITLLEMKEIS